MVTAVRCAVWLLCLGLGSAIAGDERVGRVADLGMYGVASGDVTATSAVIWSRGRGPGVMSVHVLGPQQDRKRYQVTLSAERDYIGKVFIEGLKPDSEYRYRIGFNESASDAAKMLQSRADRSIQSGRFRTAPAANQAHAIQFAWGGDLAGQNVCRDAQQGFPIFKAIGALELDFFIGLGDMIYADGVCEATGLYGNQQVAGEFGPAADLENYWAHWRYNRADAGYQALLRSTPYIGIWDDHEVVNDFGPLHDTRDTEPYTANAHLLPLGLRAFLDYNPIAESDLNPNRLYRALRWGKHLELIVLDNRQYRDANAEADNDQFVKTMLGREQVAWLKHRLRSSDATWKVIVSSVPMSIPTGFPLENGRDGWADYDQSGGFEHELRDILAFMQAEGERNVVFITTDVHFAEVFRYTPFATDPGFQVHEVVTGPLNAGLFPNRNFDTSLGAESLFFYGPESSDAVTDYAQARPWMNFGLAQLDAQGNLTLSIRDVDGALRYSTTLQPQ